MCSRKQKKADSPESESAFNVRDCELYERKTRLVDDIYRTTKSLCRSQAASTKKQSPPTDTVNGRKSQQFIHENASYQTKAGKAHDFNRGMKGRTLELLWEKFQNNSFFVYIHVFVTTWHLKYDIIDT